MRELVLTMFISLDGFVGSLDGDTGWMINPDLVAKAWRVQRMWDTSLHVVGASTFRGWAQYWPAAKDEFAAPLNRIPKAVFSRQGAAILDAARDRPGAESWANATVASGDLAAEVAKLKAQDGKPIFAHGGATFARSLIAQGLVDRFDLMVIPLALGQGVPVFDGLTRPRRMTLVESRAFPKGTVFQSYRPV